jgi:hypothetical protein
MRRMICFIVTRQEGDSLSVWAPFLKQGTAIDMVHSHTDFRIKNGATMHRQVNYTPGPVKPGTMVRCGGSEGKPILKPADEAISCVVNETEIVCEDKTSRAIYRITQHVIVET